MGNLISLSYYVPSPFSTRAASLSGPVRKELVKMRGLDNSRRRFSVAVLLMLIVGLSLHGQKIVVEKDIVYHSSDGLDLMLDVARQSQQSTR